MKTKKYLKDRIILAVLQYFGYKPDNIRQALIVPGKYYYNFGNIVKAVPISRQEHLERQTLLCNMLEGAEERNLAEEKSMTDTIKSGCLSCPFFETLPCPINLNLPDGTKICHSHKFIIIKKAEDND